MVSAVQSWADASPVVTYIARQAISDRHRRTWGYELLHRANDRHPSAARSVVLTAGLDVGLAKLSRNHRILVGFDAETLVSEVPTTLPPAQLLLGVSADVLAHPFAFRTLVGLARRGYLVCLEWTPEAVEHPELISLATLVRLDVSALGSEALAAHAERLHAHGKRLIARNVDDAEIAARTLRLGFELLQGSFLRTTETIVGRHVAPERVAALSLLSKLHDPHTSFGDLSALIQKDPLLSYQLVRFMGSAAFSRPIKVDSVQRALILLGLNPVRQWASLLLLARAAAHDEQSLVLAMTRAKMAEIMANKLAKNPTAAFTVGLFSALEHLLGQPLAELLADLPLETEVSRALLGGGGYLGDILQAILLYEDGIASAHELGLGAQQVVNAYLEAIDWAEQARLELATSA